MNNSNSILTLATNFLKRTLKHLDQKGFVLENHWHIDHLCYRTSSEENYLYKKEEFSKFSKLLIESEVNGRLISTFKLATPIIVGDWLVDLIELPAPKIGKTTIEGFEHFEIVCDLPFDEIQKRYSNFKSNTSGLAKDFNPELEYEFTDFAIKFHALSLESVINIEANTPVFSALKESHVLKILKSMNPLVAGTFPLNLNVTGSDIDILITVSDFDLVKDILKKSFSGFDSYQLDEMPVNSKKSLIASFKFQGIEFEVFGQETPSIRQDGYLHFLIEERLLKFGGPDLFNKVKDHRNQGDKTEPSFAKALGLDSNPYQALLDLQKKSNSEIATLFTL